MECNPEQTDVIVSEQTTETVLQVTDIEQFKQTQKQLDELGKSSIIVEVKLKAPWREFIKAGFLPLIGHGEFTECSGMALQACNVGLTARMALGYLLSGYTEPEMDFYIGDHWREVADFQQWGRWQFCALESWYAQAMTDCQSLPIILYGRAGDLYTKSQRPRTDMSLFLPLTLSTPPSYKQEEDWQLVPVTRYASGMSRGLFHEEDNTRQFGTYYYKEEESTIFLRYKRALIAKNKYEAAKQLGVEAERYLNGEKTAKAWYRGEIPTPADLMMTPIEMYDCTLTQDRDILGNCNELCKQISQDKRYAGLFLGLYAAEDDLDGILYDRAKKAGYDIVIFSAIGSHQVVEEVLDVRPRAESFSHLVRCSE
jgi:hypothetical protein